MGLGRKLNRGKQKNFDPEILINKICVLVFCILELYSKNLHQYCSSPFFHGLLSSWYYYCIGLFENWSKILITNKGGYCKSRRSRVVVVIMRVCKRYLMHMISSALHQRLKILNNNQ